MYDVIALGAKLVVCLLYTSDAADDATSDELGGVPLRLAQLHG